jgi:hypothetical protein
MRQQLQSLPGGIYDRLRREIGYDVHWDRHPDAETQEVLLMMYEGALNTLNGAARDLERLRHGDQTIWITGALDLMSQSATRLKDSIDAMIRRCVFYDTLVSPLTVDIIIQLMGIHPLNGI